MASWTRKQFHQANYGMFQTLPANIDMCTHIYLILVLPQIGYSYFMTGYQISHVYKYSLTESAMSQQDHQ